MKCTYRRLLSLLLCVIMAVGMICTTSFADDTLEKVYVTTAEELVAAMEQDGNYDIIVQNDIIDDDETETTISPSIGTGTKVLESNENGPYQISVKSVTFSSSSTSVNLTIKNLLLAGSTSSSMSFTNGAAFTLDGTVTINSVQAQGSTSGTGNTVYLKGDVSVNSLNVRRGYTAYLSDNVTVETLTTMYTNTSKKTATVYLSDNVQVGELAAGTSNNGNYQWFYLSGNAYVGKISNIYGTVYLSGTPTIGSFSVTNNHSIIVTDSVAGADINLTLTATYLSNGSYDTTATENTIASADGYTMVGTDAAAFSVADVLSGGLYEVPEGYTVYVSSDGSKLLYGEHTHTAGEAVTESVEATCVSDAHTDSVVYCTTCGGEVSRTTLSTETGTATGVHTWDGGEVTTEATCTTDGVMTYICTVCGETKNETIEATGHTWDDGEVTTEATCTTDGVKTYTCTVCGETKTETIEATGHTWDDGEVTTEATCTTDGVKTYTCTVCGETKTETIEATGHAWDDGEVTTEATCTTDGVRTYTCTVCGETKTETIEATGHAWEDGEVTTEATCTTDGVMTYTCTVCGETKTEVIPATGHTKGEAVIENEVAATCTEDGSYDSVVYCTVCGEELSRETIAVEATGHNYVAEVTEPTCTEGGYTTYTCSVCGDSYIADETAATGHTWSDGVVTVEATCTTDGVMTYTCTVCGETKTEVVPATGHTYGAPTFTWAEDYSSATASFACTSEDDTQTVDATVTSETTKATCTEPGETVYTATVTFNGGTYTDTKTVAISATGHTYGEPTFTWAEDYSSATAAFACANGDDTQTVDATVTSETTAATCTVGGATVYTATVTFNGETYTDTMTVVIAATGHNYVGSVVKTEATCTEDGSYVITVACTECNDELYTYTYTIPATGHTWNEGEETVAATRYTQGATTYTCTECGETKTEYTNKVNATFLFDDVMNDSQYYFIPVYWAYDLGITSGTSATLFSPSQGCTRAQFVTFLYRLAQATGMDTSIEATSTAFTDVDSDNYFYEAVLWAAENGITVGTNTAGTLFSPNVTITRAQAVTMLYRYETMVNGAPEVTTDNPFTDVSENSYYTSILWAYENGVTNGTTAPTVDSNGVVTAKGVFSPNATCTRAQMVTFLYNYAAIQD